MDLTEAKEVAIELTKQLAPESTEAVEEGFDGLAEAEFRVPSSVPQHAFHIPPETWTYAQSLAVFVGGIFADAAKDVLKKKLAQILSKLLKRREKVEKEEREVIIKAAETEGKRLRIPKEHRQRLASDLQKLTGTP